MVERDETYSKRTNVDNRLNYDAVEKTTSTQTKGRVNTENTPDRIVRAS